MGGHRCSSLCPSAIAPRLLGQPLGAHINLKLVLKGSAHGGKLRSPWDLDGGAEHALPAPGLPGCPAVGAAASETFNFRPHHSALPWG